MQKILLPVLVFMPLSVVGQGVNTIKCGSDKHYQQYLSEHPETIQERAELEAYTANFVEQYNPEAKTADMIIPVVFHVNDNVNPQKVTRSQVQSALDILNEDFTATNTDISSIRPEFASIVADMGIQFCLAQKDPSGNSTSGITYHYNNYNGREPDGYGSAVKSVESWPAHKYLNIWIVNETENDGSLYNSGWAFLPDSWYANNGLDGIVYNHRYLGYEGSSEVSGPSSWQAEMARVLTHEVGHYLNLYHTFENYCNSPGDYVSDTPYIYYHGSNNCSQNGTLCSTTTVIMDQNFMDYTPCPSMFTLGQKARVVAVLNSTVAGRNNLWSASNLIATGCQPVDDNVSVSELDLNLFVHLHPNPTNEVVSLTIDSPELFNNTVLYDSYGRVIETFHPQGHQTINLSDAPEGVYSLHLTGNKTSLVKRIMRY